MTEPVAPAEAAPAAEDEQVPDVDPEAIAEAAEAEQVEGAEQAADDERVVLDEQPGPSDEQPATAGRGRR
nr:hypothetical protein [Angustibacter aerolatus]